MNAQGLLSTRTWPPGGGGGYGPSTDPKTVARKNGFCGSHRRGIFCFSLTAGGEFSSSPHVFILKMLRFFRGFQVCRRHVEQFSAHLLPTSDFIPRIECWRPSACGYTVRSFFLYCPLLGSLRAGGYIVCSCFLRCPLLGSSSTGGHVVCSFFLPKSIKPSMC